VHSEELYLMESKVPQLTAGPNIYFIFITKV